MLLVTLLASAPLTCSSPACAGLHAVQSGAPVRQERESATPPEPGPRFAWFAGSFDELLTEARRQERVVLLSFLSQSNAYSKKLERGTLAEPRVQAELAGLLCYAVDADAKETRALRKRYQVLSSPALVFLDPDAGLRDQLSGYYSPDSLLLELRRIKANRATFSDLRARIRARADDLDARWELAVKLRAIGDVAGYEREVAELRERDPEGRSTASKRMRLAALHKAAAVTLELEPLYRFVESEQEPALLFEGWHAIWLLEGQALRAADEPERRRRHELLYFAAARALWPLVPPEKVGFLGNDIAWYIYENRGAAARADLDFALEVAQAAVAAAPLVPAVVDTLACCLFAVGRQEEALVHIRRCIELDPQNPTWRERLSEFQNASR